MSDAVERAAEQYAACAAALADGLERALAGWVERSVADRLPADLPPAERDRLLAAAAEAGRRTRDELAPRLRALLLEDVDRQPTSPLSLVRGAVGEATAVLAHAGVAPPPRDDFARRAFPDDPYELGPATFDDVDPSLHDLGIVWGAAKAHLVLTRRGAR